MDKDEILLGLEIFGIPILCICVLFFIKSIFWFNVTILIAVIWIVFKVMKYGPNIY